LTPRRRSAERRRRDPHLRWLGVAVLLAAPALAGTPTASAQVTGPAGFDQSAPVGLTLEPSARPSRAHGAST
jgi:hypothetical protein